MVSFVTFGVLIKQKYLHIMDMKVTARATLMLLI